MPLNVGGNDGPPTKLPSRKIVRKPTRSPKLIVEHTYIDLPNVETIITTNKGQTEGSARLTQSPSQPRNYNVVANPPLRIIPSSLGEVNTAIKHTSSLPASNSQRGSLSSSQSARVRDMGHLYRGDSLSEKSSRRNSGPLNYDLNERSKIANATGWLRTSQPSKPVQRIESLPPQSAGVSKLLVDGSGMISRSMAQVPKRIPSFESLCNNGMRSKDSGLLLKERLEAKRIESPMMCGRDQKNVSLGRRLSNESRLLKVVESQRFKTLRAVKGYGDYVIIVKINESRWPFIEFKKSISVEEKDRLVNEFVSTEKLKKLLANGLLKLIDMILTDSDRLKGMKRLRRVRLSESKDVYCYDCDVIDLIG